MEKWKCPLCDSKYNNEAKMRKCIIECDDCGNCGKADCISCGDIEEDDE